MSFKLSDYKYFLLVDLEATCCDKNSFPVMEMETIEIGAVIVESVDLQVLDEFTIFIKPVRHPLLTTFCTQLTTITQGNINRAPLFPEAMEAFVTWFSKYPSPLFCSWGDYDRKQLERDCRFHKIHYPMGEHLNVKQQFSLVQGTKKSFGMNRALKRVGLEFSGTQHRGIDDARNIVQLMPYILQRRRVPPE